MKFPLPVPAEAQNSLLIGFQAAALAFKYLDITLAPDAIDTLQFHGLWVPSVAGLNGLEPMFGDNYNATLENEKFEASGLDINDLVHLGVIDDNSKKVSSMDIAGDETAISNIDVCNPWVWCSSNSSSMRLTSHNRYPSCCDACHKCEGGCVSVIIFFIIPWLICSAACWSQDFCKGCD